MRNRPRREIPRPLARILGATVFRYSPGRRAYVLRLVGGRWGPVLRERPYYRQFAGEQPPWGAAN